MSNENTNEVVIAAGLVTEGQEIMGLWRRVDAADKRRFTQMITRRESGSNEPNGLVIRTGELLVALRKESEKAGQKQISQSALRQAGLSGMDKRRRSECEWFVTNEVRIMQFINAEGDFAEIDGKKQPKRKFTSVTACQNAMRKAEKLLEELAQKADGDDTTDGEGSNVGRSTEGEAVAAPASPVASDPKLAALNALSAIEDAGDFAEVLILACEDAGDAVAILSACLKEAKARKAKAAKAA